MVGLVLKSVFGNELNRRKWTDTVTDLIDMRKKKKKSKNILYKKIKFFVLK
jgi:hypothetical protein